MRVGWCAVIIFLAVQLAYPVSYYVRSVLLEQGNGNTPERAAHSLSELEDALMAYDERFAWRMFSETCFIRCTNTFTQVAGAELKLEQLVQPSWIRLLMRGRWDVYRAVFTHLCSNASELELETTCKLSGKSVLHFETRSICSDFGNYTATGSTSSFSQAQGRVRVCLLFSAFAFLLLLLALATHSHPAWRAELPPGWQLVRTLFFALFAYDSLIWFLPRSANYGIGPLLITHTGHSMPPSIMWSEVVGSMAVCNAMLAMLISLRVVGTRFAALLSLSFGAVYMLAQSDSFQHHYLLSVLAFLIGFVDRSSEGRRIAMRIVLIEFSLTYLFAAFTKMEHGYWNGGVFDHMPYEREHLLSYASLFVNAEASSVLSFVASTSCMLELILTVLIHTHPRIAALLAFALHIGIEMTGFKIGLFSFYMIVLFSSMFPLDQLRDEVVKWFNNNIEAPLKSTPFPMLVAVPALLCALIYSLIPLPKFAVVSLAVPLCFLRRSSVTRIIVIYTFALFVLWSGGYGREFFESRGNRRLEFGDEFGIDDLCVAFRAMPSRELASKVRGFCSIEFD
jgi:hypothetical protein